MSYPRPEQLRTIQLEDGFWIEDDYEILWGPFPTAAEAWKDIVEYEQNYEPPDPPGWEGGFAKNH